MLDKINKKLLEARKNKDELRKNTLTLLKADFINNEKSNNKLEDINILRGFIKRLEKSAAAYKKADETRHKTILEEVKIAEELLPELPSEEVIIEAIQDKLKEVGDGVHFGVIMKHVKEALPLADGAITAKLVKEALA